MERRQREAERARHNRQKRKETLAKYKAFYTLVLETNPEIVSAFEEAYCTRQHETDPAVFEKACCTTRQHDTDAAAKDGYKSLTEQLWAMPVSI